MDIYLPFVCLQELKEKQKELESKARLFSRLTGEKSSGKHEPAFKNNTAPLIRKQPAVSKPNKQQAVVQPLQGQSNSNSCVLLLMSFDLRNVTYLHVMSRRMRIIATSDSPVLSFPLGKQFSIVQPCCCLFQSLLLSCGVLFISDELHCHIRPQSTKQKPENVSNNNDSGDIFTSPQHF